MKKFNKYVLTNYITEPSYIYKAMLILWCQLKSKSENPRISNHCRSLSISPQKELMYLSSQSKFTVLPVVRTVSEIPELQLCTHLTATYQQGPTPHVPVSMGVFGDSGWSPGSENWRLPQDSHLTSGKFLATLLKSPDLVASLFSHFWGQWGC